MSHIPAILIGLSWAFGIVGVAGGSSPWTLTIPAIGTIAIVAIYLWYRGPVRPRPARTITVTLSASDVTTGLWCPRHRDDHAAQITVHATTGGRRPLTSSCTVTRCAHPLNGHPA